MSAWTNIGDGLGIISLTLILDCEMQSDDTDHQCCIFGGLRMGVSRFGLSLLCGEIDFLYHPVN